MDLFCMVRPNMTNQGRGRRLAVIIDSELTARIAFKLNMPALNRAAGSLRERSVALHLVLRALHPTPMSRGIIKAGAIRHTSARRANIAINTALAGSHARATDTCGHTNAGFAKIK